MSLPPSSGALVSGFQQQGTVDWAQLVGHTASFTLSVLSRFSAANVDLYTLEVGRIVSQRFEISSLGRDNVTNGLNGLVSYGILGDILWFGFGSRHVVRAMPSTSEGLMCLGLCGVLSEYYNENISPEVLHELVRILKAPPQLTPSILQWKALIRSCAGVFAKTTFGTLVEEMIQYNPYAWYHTLSQEERWLPEKDSQHQSLFQKPYMALAVFLEESKSRSPFLVGMTRAGSQQLLSGCLIFAFGYAMLRMYNYFPTVANRSLK